MKEQLWTQTIFDSYNNINTILRTIDKKVLSLGVNSYKTTNYGQDCTLELMETVIDLIERKKKILKLKQLVEDTLRNVSYNSAKLLVRRFLDKLSLSDIANEQGKSMGVTRRALHRAINEAYDYFCKDGFCAYNIERDYNTEKWLVGIYEKKYDALKKPNVDDKIRFMPQKSNSSFSVYFAL